jgi:hypothetical protein
MASKSVKRRVVRPTAKAKAKKPAPGAKSKLDRLIAALRAPKGATLADLMTLTGWQAHSVRGAMSGALKKQRGLSISSKKTGSERVYRIAGGKP